ncbi:hypothetical protein [Streptomyces sp. NBC_01465]|uniref:hypothetical protein n=1 Tax=Streptomyces sp. NBC_01465 TaxID=2903878 RepID=UPI002E32F380|nr:hypothetical protein [Streptomyces sp. NBC_01465]
MVPSKAVFFREVQEAFADVVSELALNGPVESELVIPVSKYAEGSVIYEISLDAREGSVNTSVELVVGDASLICDVEDVAIAVGTLESRGKISFSARNLKQLKKSLIDQVGCVPAVHSFMMTPEGENIMRAAGAREWSNLPDSEG